MNRKSREHKTLALALVIVAAAVLSGLAATAPAGATTAVVVHGESSVAVLKPRLPGPCPGGVEDCGVIKLDGLGVADWTYAFGPTFEADGRCFHVDGTFSITLRSDQSTISGPLSGVYCPKPADRSVEPASDKQYGNPYVENDTIDFAGGSGQFAGVSGTATFDIFFAGARKRTALNGTLSG